MLIDYYFKSPKMRDIDVLSRRRFGDDPKI